MGKPLIKVYKEVSADNSNQEAHSTSDVNSLTPKDLLRRQAVSSLKIKIPSKKSRQVALREAI
jgi:hypothetical protein